MVAKSLTQKRINKLSGGTSSIAYVGKIVILNNDILFDMDQNLPNKENVDFIYRQEDRLNRFTFLRTTAPDRPSTAMRIGNAIMYGNINSTQDASVRHELELYHMPMVKLKFYVIAFLVMC